MMLNAGLTVAQVCSLDGTYTRLLRKALNVHFSAHMTNAELYGEIPRVSTTLSKRRLQLQAIAADVLTNQSTRRCFTI